MSNDFSSIIKRLSTVCYSWLFKLCVAGNGVTFLGEPVKSVEGAYRTLCLTDNLDVSII